MSFPIDLTVDEVQFDPNGNLHQLRSDTNLTKFTDCSKQLLNIVEYELNQLKELESK
jgi:hypothetical protein